MRVASNGGREPAGQEPSRVLPPGGAPPRSGQAGVGFSPHEVRDEELRILFEAARSTPSSYNEQPWRFLVARRDDPEGFGAMRSCLDGGSPWADSAPVLLLVGVRTRFGRRGTLNPHAHQDVGRAMGRLVVRALMIDLYVHPVGAIARGRARRLFGVPEDVDLVNAAGIGFVGGDPLPASELEVLANEQSSAPRLTLEDVVYEAAWGRTARFLEALGSRRS